MKLSLREIETFPAEIRVQAEPGTFNLDYEGVARVGKVTVDLDVQQSDDEYFCQADINADVELECSRCLKQFSCALQANTDFIVTSEDAHAEAQAEARDDEDYVFYEGRSLEGDIAEPIRQALVLAIPLAPICAEDCKGICPKCKVNRNEQECSCTFDEIDPRWDKLRDLRG